MIYKTRKLIKPEDLNAGNTLFGGKIMQWVDEEAAIFAMCQLDTFNVVTRTVTFDFISPAKQKQIIEIGVEVTNFGTTSITLHVVVRNKNTGQLICDIHNMIFVSVDEEGKKVAHGKSFFEKIKVNEYLYEVTTLREFVEGDICINYDALNHNSLPENKGKLIPFISKWNTKVNCDSYKKIVNTDNPMIKC